MKPTITHTLIIITSKSPLFPTSKLTMALQSNKISPSSSLSPYSNYYTITMLSRSSSATSSRPPPIPENDIIIVPTRNSTSDQLLLAVRSPSPTTTKYYYKHFKLPSLLRSILKALSSPYTLLIPPAARQWMASSKPSISPVSTELIRATTSATRGLGRKVTGTLYGYKRGHVTFAVQTDSRSEPVFLIELAVSTASLVKEMSSGLVRIALECEKSRSTVGNKLYEEPVWSMYCNGRKCGYATARERCNKVDTRVLTTVRTVSVGAGVIPPVAALEDGGGKETRTTTSFGGEMMMGELMYMRAKFERVVGSRDSEAFYMMNPDGNGGPELSLFLLRL